MTKKGYDLFQLVLKYGCVNFRGGSKAMDWDEFRARDSELYDKICKAISELDKEETK